jgi:hypothetical protein
MANCYICSSDKFVDGHHYDCCYGKISPETVPLCRRCHRTYHTWGVGAFSPDTTGKALEVENKYREILRSLPVGHPFYPIYRGDLSPMKLEDVKRSRYWYKKWHLTPPPRLKRKKPSGVIAFRIPSNPPLCGEDWLREHLEDHTPEEIEALTIEIAFDNRWLQPVSVAAERGLKKILKELP